MPLTLLTRRDRYRPLLDRLERLFQNMDRAYDAVADRYGFHCDGCVDNCCQTRFYHHTLLEMLYLQEGLRTLAGDPLRDIRDRAQAVNQQMAAADQAGSSARIMCPLNQDGRCRLYPHRPMICRLHGIPHELHRPDRGIIRNPGCDAFFEQCRKQGKTDYIPFDRTPFYREMATLEKKLRHETGYAKKIKLTISQMLEILTDNAHEIH
ncbi:hypothetical protein JCM12296A_09620 [Desulfosarcina cetonica]|uniref:hypothetical protein n=1 Tax=Desulfosarcina cetonica TaxID=90730 RepID=UPI0006D0AF84|nr:hypothetical protein [Desulfosarcina cetonica]